MAALSRSRSAGSIPPKPAVAVQKAVVQQQLADSNAVTDVSGLSVTHKHNRSYGTARFYHNGLLRFSVKEVNMMLKLMLILSCSLTLVSTECSR